MKSETTTPCFDLTRFYASSELRNRALALCIEMGLSAHKIYHSIAVSECALVIADEVEKQLNIKVDKDTCEIGALLHDVGLSLFAADDRPEHCYVGSFVARQAGFSEKIARCIEYHDCGGLCQEYCELINIPRSRPEKKDALPETWEEKIVCYADQIVSQAGEWEVDNWGDDDAPAKASYYYLANPVKYKLGLKLPYDHPQIIRMCDFNKEMRRFIPKERFFNELQPAIQRMIKVQLEAGMPHPFPSCEIWPPKK